jgi:dihydrofolate reductase
MRPGIVDEFWIKLYPVVLGPGRPLFTDLKDRTDLVVTSSRAYPSGVVTLRYGKA